MKYDHKYEATKGLQPEPFFYWFGARVHQAMKSL